MSLKKLLMLCQKQMLGKLRHNYFPFLLSCFVKWS